MISNTYVCLVCGLWQLEPDIHIYFKPCFSLPEADSNLKLFAGTFEAAEFVWDLWRFWKVQTSGLRARPPMWVRSENKNHEENKAANRRITDLKWRGCSRGEILASLLRNGFRYERVKSQQGSCVSLLFYFWVWKRTHTHTHDHIFAIILQHLFSILFPCLWKNARISPKWQEHWQNISQKQIILH